MFAQPKPAPVAIPKQVPQPKPAPQAPAPVEEPIASPEVAAVEQQQPVEEVKESTPTLPEPEPAVETPTTEAVPEPAVETPRVPLLARWQSPSLPMNLLLRRTSNTSLTTLTLLPP